MDMSMSIILFIVLCVLMVANQMIGIANGWYRDGFSIHKMVCGLQKYGIILLGYGAIAFTAFFAGRYIPQMEYISGLLLEPIARYFIKLLNRLRIVLNDSIDDVIEHKRASKRARNARRNASVMNSIQAAEGVVSAHKETVNDAATVQLISMTPTKPVPPKPAHKPLNQSLPEAVTAEAATGRKKRPGTKKSVEA